MPHVPHTKITLPRLPPEFVVRTALRAELDAGDPADVMLICAPAGYGKTLLLADWARTSTRADTAWVSLDRDDNDPKRLWMSVVAAVAACPSVPQVSRIRSPWSWRVGAQPEFIAEFLDALERLPRPIRLILDDLHEIVEPETLYGIEALLRNRPVAAQLVLSSRFDPPLPLPRLRLMGRLRELRADRLAFSATEAATLLEQSGLHLTPAQVEVLHDRAGGWPAGLRLAALAMAQTADRDGFLAQFSGDERSVADYLVGEILSRFPEDIQEFLRLISISDPVPSGLAVELSGREEAGSLLDKLERQTSLVSGSRQEREAYCVQKLLRTYLLADLQRHDPTRTTRMHGATARWWAGQRRPLRALDHAARSGDTALLSDLLHRFAVPLILSGDHDALRDALAALGAQAIATDPLLALISAFTDLEAGEVPTAQRHLRHAREHWPTPVTTDLSILRAAAEQLGAVLLGGASAHSPFLTSDEVPAEPELEALARLSRGTALLPDHDAQAARAELEAALGLARQHGFAYLALQCLTLLGVVAAGAGDLRTMRAVSDETLACSAEHGWEGTTWSVAATSMLAYAALMRAEADEALRLASEGLSVGHAVAPPAVRFALRTVHGAATFDRGHQAAGLALLQKARSEFGDQPADAKQIAAAAMLEFRAALLLGHSAAAQTVYGWLLDRTGGNGELLLMRAWANAAKGHHGHARIIIGPMLEGSAPALLTHTLVDAWLLEAALAVEAGDRPVARRALLTALAVADPLDALRPFAQAGTGIRELLVHQRGSFGASESFASRALAAGTGDGDLRAILSERELTVLALLPSLLSLNEIAADLTVSVNTVKSHVRSIYAKLGVSSRRTAVLAAHERGLLISSVR